MEEFPQWFGLYKAVILIVDVKFSLPDISIGRH